MVKVWKQFSHSVDGLREIAPGPRRLLMERQIVIRSQIPGLVLQANMKNHFIFDVGSSSIFNTFDHAISAAFGELNSLLFEEGLNFALSETGCHCVFQRS